MSSAAALARPSPWLYGRWTDLLCGAGLGYLLCVPPLLAVAFVFDVARWPAIVALLGSMLINTPHYGATLLRVYDQAADRRKYVFFAVHASLALFALFFASLHLIWLGTLCVTLYAMWSPWHYTGQNYGIALTFLRRAEVAITPATKRMLWWSFVLSYLLLALSFNTIARGTYAPGVDVSYDSYRVLSLNLPMEWAAAGLALLGAAYFACLGASVVLLRRAGASRAELIAPISVSLTQLTWIGAPALFRGFGATLEQLPFSIIFVSAAHSLQYLWITSYYAKRAETSLSLGPFLVKATLAGAIVTGLPLILFTPQLLGSDVTVRGGLAILVIAFFNLHHFVLDGAIWKLRDGRVARVLLRSEQSAPPTEPGRSPWRALAWTVGALCFAVPFIQIVERRAAQSDELQRVERAATALYWLGEEDWRVLTRLAELRLADGQVDGAIDGYRRALDLYAEPSLLNNAAWQLATSPHTDRAAGSRAVRLATGALERGGEDASTLDTLAAAYASAGDFARAVAAADEAIRVAQQNGEPDLAASVRTRRALFERGERYIAN